MITLMINFQQGVKNKNHINKKIDQLNKWNIWNESI